MSIRWKFFFVLLAFALAPLVILSQTGRLAMDRLGRNLSQTARENLTDVAGRELLQSARNAAQALEQQRQVLEFAAGALAAETVSVLAAPAPPPIRIFRERDFLRPETAPDDLALSLRRLRRNPDGSVAPLAVSYDEPVFLGAEAGNAADMARLARLMRQGRRSLQGIADLVFSFNVTLVGGLSLHYPGHAGFPERYDPRRSEGYRQAALLGRTVWTQGVDPATGQSLVSVSAPVTGLDGSLQGVASLDVVLLDVLELNPPTTQWNTDLNAFVVSPLPDSGSPPSLHILAHRDYRESSAWVGASDEACLIATSAAPLAAMLAMIKDIRQGQDGCRELPWRGVDSIWAYTGGDKQAGMLTSFVLVVPKDVVTALPDRAVRNVLSQTEAQLTALGLTALAVLALAALTAFFGARTITRPMTVLADAARRLSAGDFTARAAVRAGDERDLVVDAFNEIGPRLSELVRIRKDLALAQEVQQHLLPRSAPRIPGLDVAGASRYCDETGGDYFGYYPLERDGRQGLTVVVGDVSGHGVAAALLMAAARALLFATAETDPDLGRRITRLNRLLSEDVAATGGFMTLFAVEVFPDDGVVRWVRAGHESALIYDPAADRFEELVGRGIALAVLDDSSYHAESAAIGPGVILVLDTDGVREAENPEGQMFGKTRLMDVIRAKATLPAAEIVQAVFEAVDAFHGPSRHEDDVTLVVIKVGVRP